MKLNKLHDDLKTVYKGKEIKTAFGFTFEHQDEIERCMKLFQSGYWSSAPFAFESYENFAVRLTPGKELLHSPIVIGSESAFWTIAPDLKSFIVMSWLRFLNDIEIINDEIKKNWESLEELSQPFREYTGEMNSLEYLKIFINDADKLRHLEEPGYYKKVYLDFWDHYYNTPQQDAYGSLIQKLKEDRTYLPEFEDEDYGVWTTRAYNALAQRAYKKINTSNVVKFEKYNFQSFIQPHGYDAVDLSFDIIPNSTGSSYTLDGILDFFDPNPDLEWDYSQEIKEHPLFKVGEIIRKDKSSYDGHAHIIAAKVIDEQLGDPLMAWDALVSAGYWSGENYNEPNLEAWRAAITLSEKHGWIEINNVLKDQLAFYHRYKNEE